MLSFLLRFLNETATFGSEMAESSGGSVIHDKGDEDPKAEAPKLPPKDEPPPKAARPLLACDLNCLLLMAGPETSDQTGGDVMGGASPNFVCHTVFIIQAYRCCY